MRDLPSGTVSFVMSDIEGSTRLLNELGSDYATILAAHRAALRAAFAAHGGTEVDTQGDAFFYAFTRAADAMDAAAAGQDALAGGPVKVRMGIHTGEPIVTEEGYVGMDVHRVARIMAAGHGGQVLVSETTARLVDQTSLRDLGEHRLKDMTAPQRLFQLGDGGYPPLRTLDATNLPIAAGPLLGRDAEVGDIVALLTSGARVVTLIGPGGIGKTRLALQVASELVGRCRDGVFWVPMAQLTDPNLVLPAIGKALGHDDAVAHLKDRETLLLLDNAEQIIDVAPQLADLVASCRQCTLLVTSRSPLHIAAEHEVPIGPLAPGAAMALFVERARAVGSEVGPSEAIGRICTQLDALPLAIELAASRTKLMDPETLSARLDRRLPLLTGGSRDAPDRQRTLLATIDWSHDLLNEDGRRLFRRLACFVGGFTLEAAEAVCDADLDTLAALVDMSLVKAVTAERRFLMLETLREYAAARLDESPESDRVHLAHATWFAELAEHLDRERRLPGRGSDATALLEAEAANLGAAARWAGSSGQHSIHLRVLTAAGHIFLRGSPAWIRAELEAALGSDTLDPLLRVRGEASLSFTAYRQGDLEEADRAGHRALALAREHEDHDGIAKAHNYLANAANARGQYDQARRYLEQALDASRAAGDRAAIATALVNLSDVALTSGEYAEATAHAVEAREMVGPTGDPHILQTAYLNAATGLVRLRRLDEADPAVREAIRLGRQLDDWATVEAGLRILAMIAVERGDLPQGARLMGAASHVFASLDQPREPTEQALEDDVQAMLKEMDPAVLAQELEDGRALTIDDALTGEMGRDA